MDCIDAVTDVTNATGIAAVKITSLVRPQLLLKMSSLFAQIKQAQLDEKSMFSWKSLLSKSDDEFYQVFNNIKGLENVKEKILFNANELGEIRNMLQRMDEILEVD